MMQTVPMCYKLFWLLPKNCNKDAQKQKFQQAFSMKKKKKEHQKQVFLAKTKIFAALRFGNTQTSVLHPNLMTIENLKMLSPTHPKVN